MHSHGQGPEGEVRWRVPEVGRAFLRLGATAFGGPAAHIALMEDEFVRVRGWVTRAEFVDLLTVANVLPGPGSTELAMLIGMRRAGWAGLVVAGAAFILPATLLVWMLAWWYSMVGARTEVAALLSGLQPVALAVVAQALWRLGQGVLRSWTMAVISVASIVMLVAGVHELTVLVAAGLASMGARAGTSWRERAVSLGALGLGAPLGVASTSAVAVSVGGLFTSFLKIGCIVFGSGYVLLSFLRAEFVERHAWLSEGQLLDAIAIGQVTPGPVFSAATFVGYVLGGNAGAISATLGIFLPAFVFAALSGTIVARLRQSPTVSAALDGLNAASLALMTVVLVALSRGLATAGGGVVAAFTSLLLLQTTSIRAGWLFVLGALLGYSGILR